MRMALKINPQLLALLMDYAGIESGGCLRSDRRPPAQAVRVVKSGPSISSDRGAAAFRQEPAAFYSAAGRR